MPKKRQGNVFVQTIEQIDNKFEIYIHQDQQPPKIHAKLKKIQLFASCSIFLCLFSLEFILVMTKGTISFFLHSSRNALYIIIKIKLLSSDKKLILRQRIK